VVPKCFNYLDPQWTPWDKWSPCSVTCGLGGKTRKRSCVDKAASGSYGLKPGIDCLGPKEHDDQCELDHCPVDGGWSKWQNWGECTVACGEGGKRLRRKYCVNPFPIHGGKKCPGKGEEPGECVKMPPCPGEEQNCVLSSSTCC
jgi:hypothetical protein